MSTGDPEMVYTVLQHRDYHNTSMALEGVPELLHKILEVSIKPAMPYMVLNAGAIIGHSLMLSYAFLKSFMNSEYDILIACPPCGSIGVSRSLGLPF